MESCIEAMAERARGARARRALSAASLDRPPARASRACMGLMPATAAAPTPAYALKTICLFPANPARGLDAHQGAVLLLDGETGELQRAAERLADHRDPHGSRLGGRDASAARAATTQRARDPRCRRPGAGPPRGDARGARRPRDPHLVAQPETRPSGLPARSAQAVATVEEPRSRRRRRRHDHGSSREPVMRERGWPGSTRERGRLLHPDSARARHGDDRGLASLFVDRRESTVNEAGDYLLAAAGGRDRPRPHPGRDRRGPDRHAPRPRSTETS